MLPGEPRMLQPQALPLSASGAVAGRGFLASLRPVRKSRRRVRLSHYNAIIGSSSEKEKDGRSEAEEEVRWRLAQLDAQLEGLSEPKKRSPPTPPPPDPYLDRAVITGKGVDELPELSPSFLAYSTLVLFILTIFTNVMFNLYIKPSVDGDEQPVQIQRVPLVDPAERQFP